MPTRTTEPTVALTIRVPASVHARLRRELSAGADKPPHGAYQELLLKLLTAHWRRTDAA